tara:strand:- start:262 stop:1014 length:753 start_codon:yes stop_codon:yes gene_type:complete
MKHKNIVIIGSDGKFGNFISKHLSENLNHHVINIDITNNKKQTDYICDITNEENVKDTIEKIREKYKSIDCLINFSHYKGSGSRLVPNNDFFKSIEDYPFEEWKKTLDVNLNGLFLTTKEFSKIFIKQKMGNFIFVSSTYGIVSPNKNIYGESGINSPIGYAVTKAGICNFTRYLATHLSEYGIIANCLVPGGIKDTSQNKEFINNYSNLTPLNRLSNLDDYVEPINFLIDPGKYYTGSILTVDGGWTAW